MCTNFKYKYNRIGLERKTKENKEKAGPQQDLLNDNGMTDFCRC